jgi:superfamily II DNA or RNA helicase/HKD family nuclease
MDNITESFNNSLQTGYVDKTFLSSLDYQPELIVNQKNPPKKVLSTILHEFENCNHFLISVAFVTTSGVATIINKLKELEKREIKGKILVSQYLNFTQPEALKKLGRFKNIELRIATAGNAHSKGYIFKNKEHYNLIVGSSNLTAQALSSNKEWNIKVSALDESGLVEKVLSEFHSDFEKGVPVDEEYIAYYEKVYQKQFLFTKKISHENIFESEIRVIPNSMQIEALKNLYNLRLNKKNKALIISATGTGKTYLSAFDAKAFKPQKLLFVVHRLTIAKDSLDTFRSVFGKDKTMGLYTGDERELDCDFVFSTIQTISKAKHLDNFPKDHFDYIIIDETHRSGADSYQRLIEYFEPKFLLGMTATPERTDGNDIFKLFDHNIAYEIRLHKAMEEEMLSSFHYYGVTDLMIGNNKIENKSDFNLLISSERVNRIIDQAKFYGTDNGITRGLIFCSRKEEAIQLAQLFNFKKIKAVALTGDSSEEERAKAIEKLESENLNEKLEYIFTVDIFNEGIDIPKVNQIIMLRPTESAIIFIQQLGRGLRKVDGKGYLTVIDFIGNYENNYLIPIALYGDTSYNKDSLRKLITEGSRMIPGASTINFDEITKERIFQSIDSANMQLYADLKKDYYLLKYKLGRIPMMMDFLEHGSRDPYLFVEYSSSYYNFIFKLEQESVVQLATQQIKLLELFSTEINNSKRVEESLIIKLLIEFGSLSSEKLKKEVVKKYSYTISDETIKSCVSNLNFEFIREKKRGKMLSAREIYDLNVLKIDNNNFVLSNSFIDQLKNDTFKEYLLDSVLYSIHEFDKLFQPENWQNGFVLYRKYTRKDVFRILNVPVNPVAQNVGGYIVNPDNSHCPIFVNYHKEEHISESTKYEDEFINNREFNWMSKSNRKIESKDVQSILGKKGPIRLPLFINKYKREGMDFYYMGEVNPDLNHVELTTINDNQGKQKPIVRIRFDLSSSVSTSMFNYLEEKIVVKAGVPEKKKISIPFQGNINFEPTLKNPIPLYNFYAAAGTFSEMQSEKEYTLIEGPDNMKPNSSYFACKIVGESMNKIIPNGSICLFRPCPDGGKTGMNLLIENRDIQDFDFNSCFTIKQYSSVKTNDNSENEIIILSPKSDDGTYVDMVFNKENGGGMTVIGEFVKVLK